MTNTIPIFRPVPRWVYVWSIVTVVVTFVLLALGGLVTTFRVGMADPVWPTEPWYLFFIDWTEPSRGFLIEHTHRLAGFSVGGLVSLLALFICWSDPRKGGRYFSAFLMIGLIGLFGMFHGQMMKQVKAEVIQWPMPTIYALAGSAGILLLFSLGSWLSGVRYGGLRFLSLLALIGVMIQGLLGGLRVRLNDLFGTDLAAVHGVFGQIVFAMLIGIAMLTARRSGSEVDSGERRRLFSWSLHVVAFVVLQLIWGAWIRHRPEPLAQRLHFLTAFLVLAFSVVFFLSARNSLSWRRLRFGSILLLVFLACQLTLGVEAWLGKFGTGMEEEKITLGKAIIRTLHVLVGTGILATSTALAFLLGIRKPDATVAMGMDARSERREGTLESPPQNNFETPQRVGDPR